MSLSKEKVAGITVATALVATLGTACTSGAMAEHPSTTSVTSVTATPNQPRCRAVEAMNLIGANKDGHFNAKNTGECFGLYDQRTFRDIGVTVTKDEAFVVDCWDYKPTAFKVETSGGVTGYVNLGGTVLQQFEQHKLDTIPECPEPSVTVTN